MKTLGAYYTCEKDFERLREAFLHIPDSSRDWIDYVVVLGRDAPKTLPAWLTKRVSEVWRLDVADHYLELPVKSLLMLHRFLNRNRYDGIIKFDSDFIIDEKNRRTIQGWNKSNSPIQAGRIVPFVGWGEHDRYHFRHVTREIQFPADEKRFPNRWIQGNAYYLNRAGAAKITARLDYWNARSFAYEDVMVSKYVGADSLRHLKVHV